MLIQGVWMGGLFEPITEAYRMMADATTGLTYITLRRKTLLGLSLKLVVILHGMTCIYYKVGNEDCSEETKRWQRQYLHIPTCNQ